MPGFWVSVGRWVILEAPTLIGLISGVASLRSPPFSAWPIVQSFIRLAKRTFALCGSPSTGIILRVLPYVGLFSLISIISWFTGHLMPVGLQRPVENLFKANTKLSSGLTAMCPIL